MTHEDVLGQLLKSQIVITKANLSRAPRVQGAYILWLAGEPPVCLKVGIAGPRRGEGLWGRLKRHFRCVSVLGRHMAADKTSP